ncbi:hypothetical protein XELAEV_18047867mg [Xenopus laevis]|uniref:Helix-turn-helix domain-containing protein n=1 Tax=Xenopus laevis TaxID=8355 RepID=A0A974BW03_XENLA|nr:hypothetical protein XELAEV_18047867mg [Xenopus laevis]
MSYSLTHIYFLDTTIHIRENTIQTTIYRKPMDKPSYLMYDSFHPDHTKHSIIYSQALRYNRMCSEIAERNHRLKADFINRGYNPMIVDQYIHAATRIPRSHLLQYKQKPEINQVPLVVTYNPQLRTLRKIYKVHFIRTRGSKAYSQTHHSQYSDKVPYCTPPKMEHIPVAKSNAKSAHTSDKIPIPGTLEEYSIPGHYNSSSSNVVYLIQFTKCLTEGLYIGETVQSLRKRNTHHRFTITNKKLDTPIENHFNSPYHSIKDLRILVLKGNFKTDDEKKNGINLDLGFMANYVD